MEISGFVDSDSRMIPVARPGTCGATSVCRVVRWYNKLHFQKSLRPEFAAHPVYCAAFRKEFELGIRLEHRGLPRYIHFDESDDVPAILMEYIDGIPLSEFIKEHPAWFASKKNLRRFMSELFDIAGYLHSHGIIHLDIKPDNILITRSDCQARLIDLGMAATDAFDTSAGFTPSFAAPEVIAHNGKPTPAADLYSIGKTLSFLRANTPGFPNAASYRRLERALLKDSVHERPASTAAAYKFITTPQYTIRRLIIGATVVAIIFGGMLIYSHYYHEHIQLDFPTAILSASTPTEATPESQSASISSESAAQVAQPKPTEGVDPTLSPPDFEAQQEEFKMYVRHHTKSHAEDYAAWLNAIVARGEGMTENEKIELDARTAAIHPLMEKTAREADVAPGLTYDQKLIIASLEYNRMVRQLTSGTLHSDLPATP